MEKKKCFSGRKTLKTMKRFWLVYVMALPGLAYLLINNYIPMAGLVVAFKNFKAADGIWGSAWAGLSNFKYLFSTDNAWVITRNTLLYNIVFITAQTFFAIALAIVLSELRSRHVRKLAQSFVLLPYLISWVIASYLVYAFLGDNGLINNSILAAAGADPVAWYSSPEYWPVILTVVNLWHNVGYYCVIYYASIVGVDTTLYDAARIDGASHWQRIRFVTVPCIRTTIITMVLLSLGRIFYADFGLFYQIPMNSGALFSTTNVIDTYVYRGLLEQGNIGMTAAACLYQSIVGFIVILAANGIVRKVDRDSAFF